MALPNCPGHSGMKPRRSSANNSKCNNAKGGMTQGALLPYLVNLVPKENPVEREIEKPVERETSPDIEYLGTYSTNAQNGNADENVTFGSSTNNIVIISVRSTNPDPTTITSSLPTIKEEEPPENVSRPNLEETITGVNNEVIADQILAPETEIQESEEEPSKEQEVVTDNEKMDQEDFTNVVPSNDTLNIQEASVVLAPVLGTLPQSPKLNVANFYRTKKRSHSRPKSNKNVKKLRLEDNDSNSKEGSFTEMIAKRRRSSGSSASSSREMFCPSNDPVEMSTNHEKEFYRLLQKKRYKDLLQGLATMLNGQNKMYPSSFMLAQIIEKCIFGRASRDVHLDAINFLNFLVESLPITSDTYKFYLDTLTKELNSDGQLVKDLLTALNQNLNLKQDDKFILQFFEVISKLLDKEFEFYTRKPVKINQPLIVVLMSMGSNAQSDFNNNWVDFVSTVTKWSSKSDEAKVCMKWITIIAKYLESFKNRHWATGYKTMVNELITKIIDRKDDDYGLEFLQLLGTTGLGLDLCGKLVKKNLPHIDDQNKWENILCELTANLPRASEPSVTINQCLPLTESDDEFSRFLMEKVNNRGESRLHLLCGQKKTLTYKTRILNYRTTLHRMKEKRVGDINVRDNALNTPLHDVCFHGHSDVLNVIWEKFTDPEPGPHRVNLLAQNHTGESALHNAVVGEHSACIEKLVLLSQVLGCHAELLRLRNDRKMTALDLVPNSESEDSERIRALLQYPGAGRKRRSIYAGVRLPEAVIDDIESSTKLRNLVLHWRQVWDVVKAPLRITSNSRVQDYQET